MPGQVISREDPGYNEARTVINADDRPAPRGESEHSSCKGSVKEQSRIGDCVERSLLAAARYTGRFMAVIDHLNRLLR
jgi:hypothetical protein